MKNRKLLIITLFFCVYLAFFFIEKTTKTHAEKLRENHVKLLTNHPYQKRVELSKKERMKLGIPPNAYYDQKFLNEINPITGRTHKENVYELQNFLAKTKIVKRSPGDGTDNSWTERGPNNVGGRTRAIIFDPNDTSNETVFAGGVSGGLWKNTNISNPNSAWSLIGIPENLSVSSIAVDPNNSQIFYVGTGESFTGPNTNGNGLWKSIDGGSTWNKVFGGSKGPSFFSSNAILKVNTPSSISREYKVVLATPKKDFTRPITGELALVNDGIDNTGDACETIINTTIVSGRIAMIETGSCEFTTKIFEAQRAGAIAVIIMNNINGTPQIQNIIDGSINIPVFMIGKSDGELFKNTLRKSSVNVTLLESGVDFNGTILPGVQNINDVLVRNNAGTSEIYISVGTASAYDADLGVGSVGIYKSVDGGASFTLLNLPAVSGSVLEPNNIELAIDNSIYLSVNNKTLSGVGKSAILRSNDGVNFTILQKFNNGFRTEISLSSLTNGVGYALIERLATTSPVKIYRTTDGFKNITEVNLPNDIDTGIPANDFTRGQAGYNLLIKVDPRNDSNVYVGGIDLFKSINNGTNWTQISRWHNGISGSLDVVHADQHEIAFANNSSATMLFSNDGGVYYSNNAGATIKPRKKNYNTLQFYNIGVAPTNAFTGDYFLAGAQDNGTQLFENAPATSPSSSSEASGGDGAYSFFDTDGHDQYYITNYVYNRVITLYDYKTDRTISINTENDNKGDFINQEELDSNLNILYANYSSGKNFIIRRYANLLSNPSAIVKTSLTNNLLNAEPSVLKISPFTTTNSLLLAGLKNARLLKISNANNTSITWKDISGPNFIGTISDIEFGTNENEIFVTMQNYGVQSIWYTNNGGKNWSEKEGDFPDIPVLAILQNPLNTKEVIIGTELGVWKTNDFSINSPKWVHSYNGMSNVAVTDMDLRDDNTVFVSTYGRGVFSGKFTGATASVNEVVKGKEMFTVFPTVSNGEFTVFSKSDTRKMKMNIYNLSGSKMYEKDLNFYENENQKINVNLSRGIYLVQLIDHNNNNKIKKIVIK